MNPTPEEFRAAIKYFDELRERQRRGEIVTSEGRAFRDELGSYTGERQCGPLIQRHLVRVCRMVYARYPMIFKEFPIGMKRPDYVVLDSYSGGWDATAIEFEPPGSRLFTATGRPADRLAGALTQLRDWRNYVVRHRNEVLQRLSDYYQHHDLISGERRDPPQDCNCVSLADPNSEVFWHWWIVIGRRGDLTADDLARKAALRETDGVVVATYDRLVEAVDAID